MANTNFVASQSLGGGFRQTFTKASAATVFNYGDLVAITSGGNTVEQALAVHATNVTSAAADTRFLGAVDYYLVNGTSETTLNVVVADASFYIWLPLVTLSTNESTRVDVAATDKGDACGITRIPSGDTTGDNALLASKYVAVRGGTGCAVIADIDTTTNQVKVFLREANRTLG